MQKRISPISIFLATALLVGLPAASIAFRFWKTVGALVMFVFALSFVVKFMEE